MFNLDIKDKKLLFEIDLNARLGTSALGKKIKMSQENVDYRLKRLNQRNIISGYSTIINFSKLGYAGYAVYVRFQNVNKEKKEQIINELKENPKIYWIATYGGKYDLVFAILSKNIIEFNDELTKIQTKYEHNLKDTTIAIRVSLEQYQRKYLTDKNKEQNLFFGKKIEEEIIDELDFKILRILSADARIHILQIAKKLNKPMTTVRDRIKKLEQKEIIQGYSAMIRCQEYGYQSYQIFIETKNLNKQKKLEIYEYCKQHKNIIFCVETVGKWNFEIICEVKNQIVFQDFLIELRSKFQDEINDAESISLFDHYIKYNLCPN